MGRFVLGAVVLLMVVSGCGAASSPPAGSPQSPPWRWESYGGVEVSVPGDWAWGNSLQRLTQWCIAFAADRAAPTVGRPGLATQVGCPAGGGTALANTGTTVGLGRTTAPDGVEHEGDRTTVRLDTVEVIVQAPAELRERIAATVRSARTDSNGCASTHVVSDQPQWRPGRAFSDVTGATVCKYQIGGAGPRLLSSTRIDAAAATRALAAVAAAPAGNGPDDPARCAKDHAYGDEIIVVRAGRTELVIRYDGCDHHGFDDGGTVRQLTGEALALFLTGPHQRQ